MSTGGQSGQNGQNDPAGESGERQDVRARLREVETDLAYLRGELREPTGDPQDHGDAAEDLVAREDRGALMRALEVERDRLRRQLGLR